MCFSCGRILVALFCTFSKASMSFFKDALLDAFCTIIIVYKKETKGDHNSTADAFLRFRYALGTGRR